MEIQKGKLRAFKRKRYHRKHNEEKCYDCKCGGEIIECDECPKCFHLQCLPDLEDVPEGLFSCAWHTCNSCKNKTETGSSAGYYCAHCPTSYCSDCKALGEIEGEDLTNILFPSEEVFTSLRRNGFTLQHKDSLLFVCSKCTDDTDIAVYKLQTNNYSDLKNSIIGSESTKIYVSVAMMHKKLLRKLPDTIDSPVLVSNNSKKRKFEKEPTLSLTDSTSNSKSKPLDETEIGDDTVHPSISSCAASAVALGESAITTIPAIAILSNPLVDSAITVISDTLKYSEAVLKFFEPSSAIISKMKAKGWTFPSSTYQAHRLLGLRCRGYFPHHGLSNGTLVAHLAGKKNDGLPILRCVHDDGDEEDLDEEEATTAVGDYDRNCLTKADSNSFIKERRRQLEVEMQSLLRAQGDAQIFKANSLTKVYIYICICIHI
jgi:hypothetical protein